MQVVIYVNASSIMYVNACVHKLKFISCYICTSIVDSLYIQFSPMQGWANEAKQST